MHRRACSCIKLSELARLLCLERSLVREEVIPRFVNAQQLSGTIAQGGRSGSLKVSFTSKASFGLFSLAQRYGLAKIVL